MAILEPFNADQTSNRVTGLGAFWLAFAATLTPAYNAEAAFTANATTAAAKAAGVASFEASLGRPNLPRPRNED